MIDLPQADPPTHCPFCRVDVEAIPATDRNYDFYICPHCRRVIGYYWSDQA